jgi:hypothetical protein
MLMLGAALLIIFLGLPIDWVTNRLCMVLGIILFFVPVAAKSRVMGWLPWSLFFFVVLLVPCFEWLGLLPVHWVLLVVFPSMVIYCIAIIYVKAMVSRALENTSSKPDEDKRQAAH